MVTTSKESNTAVLMQSAQLLYFNVNPMESQIGTKNGTILHRLS